MEEIWKPIKGYEDYYISNYGNVVSKKRKTIIRKTFIRNGYVAVVLFKDNVKKTFSVHRLVAISFLPNPNNLPQVNHKDEDKTNNFVYVNHDGNVDVDKSNLEWCNIKYNVTYGTTKKRMVSTRNNKKSLNSEKQVIQYSKNGDYITEYKSISEAARFNNLSLGDLSEACNGKRKTLNGYIWKIKNVS